MSSDSTTTHDQVRKHKISSKSLTNIKTVKTIRKVLLHQPMSPSPPDDWVLFPQDIVTKKYSSVRHAQSGDNSRLASARRHTPPPLDSHVIEGQKAIRERRDSQRTPEPYKRSNCLNHMSSRNCTVSCYDVNPLQKTKVPPKAPSPPRLPTPDLPDIGEDDLWSCCKSSESDQSDQSTQDGDDFWNEMSMRVLLPLGRP